MAKLLHKSAKKAKKAGVTHIGDLTPDPRNARKHTPGATRVGTVENDGRSDWTEAWALFPGDVAYVWHASPFVGATQLNLAACKFFTRALIVWKKPHLQISRGHYHWQHETCWYAVKKGDTAKWCGDRTQTTVWEIPFVQGGADSTTHGTQKPVECMARPIRNHGNKDDDVYDPFLGSGTTIIAAEQLGRRCFGLEISPKYCDIILQRWENLTGNKARRDGDF
jgi:DNA modification methylase